MKRLFEKTDDVKQNPLLHTEAMLKAALEMAAVNLEVGKTMFAMCHISDAEDLVTELEEDLTSGENRTSMKDHEWEDYYLLEFAQSASALRIAENLRNIDRESKEYWEKYLERIKIELSELRGLIHKFDADYDTWNKEVGYFELSEEQLAQSHIDISTIKKRVQKLQQMISEEQFLRAVQK